MAELEQLERFEQHVPKLAKEAIDNKQSMSRTKCRIAMTPYFGITYFEANAYRIPEMKDNFLIKHNEAIVEDNKKLNHFHICIEGITLTGMRRNQHNINISSFKAELATMFGEAWFDEHVHLVYSVRDTYLHAMNQAPVQPSRFARHFDLPPVVASNQGSLRTCSIHAMSFCIAWHIQCLYGSSYAVGRDQILYIMQALCACWQGVNTRSLVNIFQQNIGCGDVEAKKVWFSNEWGDRRVRINLSIDKTTFSGMLDELSRGMSVLCTVVMPVPNVTDGTSG